MQNSEYLSHSDACDVVNYCLKTKFGIDSTDESQPPSTQTVAPNAAGEFYLLAKGPIPSLLRRLARTDSPQHLFLVNLEAKCIDLGDGIRANFCEVYLPYFIIYSNKNLCFAKF
jgi:hypothetical protein